jgi:predicted helicase
VAKYAALLGGRDATCAWVKLNPLPVHYFLVPKSLANQAEYEVGISLTAAFALFQNGIKTDRDDLFFGESKEQLDGRMRVFFSVAGLKEPFRSTYRIEDSSSYRLLQRRSDARFRATAIRRCLYRPFDERWLYYEIGLTSRPAWDTMQHMIAGNNLALLACRQQAELGFSHVFATRLLSECCAVSLKTREITSVFPLWRHPVADALVFQQRDSSFTREFLQKLTGVLGDQHKLTPEGIFGYIYGVLHSPTYRTRYGEFLKIDFPRIPLPTGPTLFFELARLGGELIALHLMESPKLNHFIATYAGPKNPEVGRVGWSEDTVWLDAAATRKGQSATPGTTGFRGVPETVWNFHIGGYQVCEKWLKDRKGRNLLKDDIIHYQKIVVALYETIRLMKEIDEVIEAHGGWPDAFAVGAKAQALSGTKVIPFPTPEELRNAETRPLRKAAEGKGEYKAAKKGNGKKK